MFVHFLDASLPKITCVITAREEPMVVSVLGSVAVIGDSVRKEELEAANERGQSFHRVEIGRE